MPGASSLRFLFRPTWNARVITVAPPQLAVRPFCLSPGLPLLPSFLIVKVSWLPAFAQLKLILLYNDDFKDELDRHTEPIDSRELTSVSFFHFFFLAQPGLLARGPSGNLTLYFCTRKPS